MKEVVLFVMFVCTCGLLRAQQPQANSKDIQEKLKEYRSRYDNGERERKFMREYVSFSQAKRSLSDLEKIADEYLQSIPFKKRYTGDNLKIFTSGVKDYNAITFKDLLSNWNEARVENKGELATHVENTYRLLLFQSRLKKHELTADFIHRMKVDLEKVAAPNKDFSLMLLEMCTAADHKDEATIIQLFQEYITPKNEKQWNHWNNHIIINSSLNLVLESADKTRCEEMLTILKSNVDTKNKKSIFNSLYQNFEGKLMLFNAEGKKAICPNKPVVDKNKNNEVSGFMFNTSWGGVMTEKEYAFLRDVYSSSDDTLKQKYLHTVLQVFRYNGYTVGLESLKPLIEKNVKDCKEKQEILSRYKTYAHLAPGKPAPEFKLKDPNGKEHALSDYRGKVVVIDVWATWCGGCIEKLPYFLATRDKYKGRDDIVFLVISIDQKSVYNRWKFAHPRYNLMDIISLIAHPEECTFSDDYNITGIPRYFVIDREGKIVNVYAQAPDGKRFGELIEQTLDSNK